MMDEVCHVEFLLSRVISRYSKSTKKKKVNSAKNEMSFLVSVPFGREYKLHESTTNHCVFCNLVFVT